MQENRPYEQLAPKGATIRINSQPRPRTFIDADVGADVEKLKRHINIFFRPHLVHRKDHRLGTIGSIKHQGGDGGVGMEGCGVKALILSTKLNPTSRIGILGNLLIFT